MTRHAKASPAGSNSDQAGSSGSSTLLLKRFVLTVLTATTVLALSAAPASAAKHHFLETFGSSAQPSFSFPFALAVDQATGDLLVADKSANALNLKRFNPDGTPANFSALGTNVIDGKGPADADKTPQEGLSSTGGSSEEQLAVDNSGGATNGNIYVTQEFQHLVDIFASDGTYLGQLTESSEGPFAAEVCGVAVDSSGAVYVGDYGGTVHKFTPSPGLPLKFDNTANFTVPTPCTLAAGAGPSAGSLFVTRWGNEVSKLDSTTGESKYVASEGANRTVSVDPVGGHVYAVKGNTIEEYDASGATGATLVSIIPFATGVRSVAVDGSSGNVYVLREGTPNVEVFGPIAPHAPIIEKEQAASVVTAEATLSAEINPEELATTFRIEYGSDTSYGQGTAEKAVGADASNHKVSTTLTGLVPGTVYHWRIIATNSVGTTEGPDHVFNTYRPPAPNGACPNQTFRTGPSAALSDCRAYEMVSPVAKNNSDIYAPINVNSNVAKLDQSASSGDKLTYTTSQGFGDTKGVPYVSQYIASRDIDGWSNHSITSPQGVSPAEAGLRVEPEFTAFTADLCVGALRHTTSPPLTADAVEGFFNIYRRQNCGDEEYEAVTTSEPPTTPATRFAPVVQGLSADGRCVVFFADDQLTPDANPGASPHGSNRQLYETCDGQLRLVSLLPNGEANQNPRGSSVGSANYEFGFRSNTNARAVSADGTRIYWSDSVKSSELGANLYLRINADQPQSAINGGECTEESKGCTIALSSSDDAHFWSASQDGSKALFTVGANQGGDLYEFDLDSQSSTPIASEVIGVVGASEDASRIAFASGAVLSAGPNAQGESPSAGGPNLYLFDSTRSGADRYRFVATLSKADSQEADVIDNLTPPSPINLAPSNKTSRVSPDGRHIAFMSTASLTGYNNTDIDSGEADAEIYAYDATANGGEGQLRCVSCNPSGQRPAGRNVPVESQLFGFWVAALLHPYQTELYGSRVISDDGKRIFFDAYEALIPSDTNGKADVYQWEAVGSGDCSEQAPAYSPLNEGCISLISSGESSVDSEFIDASPDGRDVFFTTASSLLPQDPGLVDIYDARAGGGYAPPPSPPPSCEGEACQGPLAPPNDPTPASSAFEGTGNVKSAKKKHRKRKAHHKKRRQTRANENRRNAR